ncbi:MAG TPA: hypothetical protein VHU89_16490 [Acidobacteriaceae bacterium]|jgi:hypothetical protein|nr:hypothetical protein [Acidobacteriaceae bacterium]
MRLHPALLSFVALVLVAGPLAAQAPAHIAYTFEHPQLQPSRYTITIDENGTAHFISQPGLPQRDDDVFPAPIDRSIHIDNDLRDGLFRYARTHSYFATDCNRHQSNLAFTGHRTLAYAGPDGQGSCAFIWAGDPVLQHLVDQLGAVALTIEIGRRLDVEVRHDRLGLDAELESLQDAVKDRRASDLPNIAEQLQTIAEDQQVMIRARKRAVALLSRCETEQKSN